MSGGQTGNRPGVGVLTHTERWCVAVLSSWGLWSDSAIARAYGINPGTVRKHRYARAARLAEQRAAATALPGEPTAPSL